MFVLFTNVIRLFWAALFSLWKSLHQILSLCVFVSVFTKGLLLTSTTPTIPILMAEIAVLSVLDIRLPASRRISMQNRFVSDGWIRFELYYADVSLPKRHH